MAEVPEQELDLDLSQDQGLAEEQIRQEARIVDYDIREYPIEVLVQKFLTGEAEGKNEIFIPDYQRNFVWSLDQQSRFIESVMIGLPIPYLFVADVGSEDEEQAGRLEIVDGTQRIRTLAAYLTSELSLRNLVKLPALNGSRFKDLLTSRQRRFKRITIRLIELTENAREETRRDMFDRINSGGSRLNPMETRRGVRQSPFLDLVQRLAASDLLRTLAPLSEASVKRRDYDELVVRFFAYADQYANFERSVIDFINDFVDVQLSTFSPERQAAMEREWTRMLAFVEANFRYGFRKSATNTRTPRVRFEAISVGVALALRQQPDLRTDPEAVGRWAYGEEFNALVASDGANSRPRIAARIEFVRNQLLGQA